MADELAPCAYCGSQHLMVLEGAIGGSYAAVLCQRCHATGPEGASRDEAVTLWNARVDPPAEAG